MEQEVDSLLGQFVTITHRLRELGVLRAAIGLGDYFEWFCANKFDLSLETSQVTKGFDATDRQGNRIQIKSRYYRKTGNSFDGLHLEDFDFLMPVIYEKETYRVLSVHMIPVDAIRKIGLKAGKRFRWTNPTQEECEQYLVFSRNTP